MNMTENGKNVHNDSSLKNKRILMVGNTEMSVFYAREEVVKAFVDKGYDVVVSFSKGVYGDGETSSKRVGC